MLTRLRDRAVTLVEKRHGKVGAVAILPIIIALAPVIFDAIQKCFADEGETAAERSAAEARTPGVFSRSRLRREIRNEIPGVGEEVREVREAVYDAILEAGKEATAEDFAIVGPI